MGYFEVGTVKKVNARKSEWVNEETNKALNSEFRNQKTEYETIENQTLSSEL